MDKAISFLESEGYEFLGEEYGLFFYKDVNGRVWGSSCDSVYQSMKESGFGE